MVLNELFNMVHIVGKFGLLKYGARLLMTSILGSDVLLFKYNGKSCFQLMCFDSNCVEKTLPPKSVGRLPVKFFIMFKWDCYRENLVR